VEISLGPAGSAVGGPRDQQGEDTPALTKEPAPAEPVQKAKPESVQETVPISEKKPNPLPETPIEPVKKNEPVKNAVTESRSEPKPETTPVKDTAPPTKASVAGDAGKNGSKNQNNTGSGDNSAGGGLPGDAHDYAATLLAWLEQYKEYPRRARLRRQQGTVLLYFMVDRQGQVLDYRIEKSSGYPALDEEVKKLIERAQPLPAMPDTMKKNSLALVVPVQYFLR